MIKAKQREQLRADLKDCRAALKTQTRAYRALWKQARQLQLEVDRLRLELAAVKS